MENLTSWNELRQELFTPKEIAKSNLRVALMNNDRKVKKMEKLTSWDEFEKTIFTPEEIAESDLRVALIGELIKARDEQGISQKELEKLSGVKQPSIARLEKLHTDPRLHTLIKLLVPLGKTLAIVPLETAKQN